MSEKQKRIQIKRKIYTKKCEGLIKKKSGEFKKLEKTKITEELEKWMEELKRKKKKTTI